MLAYIHPITKGDEGPDNSLPEGGGGHPWFPGHKPPGNATLPVLPGIWPPPNTPNLPVDPGFGGGPIIIQGHPENPIALPPGIYPPLPPPTTGKYAILVWVVGVGHRWLVMDAPEIDNTLPGTPQPK